MSGSSIFWHDYETWGANPQKDPAAQFAGIRTDLDLNPIGKPLKLYCQIPSDYLPHPQACLITGITPQLSLRDGVNEAQFIERIHQEFSQANTCVAGYNSIRFDDEVTRYTLYRNFYDPYAREWQRGSSRWDIIDMVRACYALRPEGINWPQKEDGTPSFRLEDLTKANDIAHESAHDAMSDVYATIALAKLIKTRQPKLYDYLFELRNKKNVQAQLDCYRMTPVVHVSSKLPAAQGCCTWVAPICQHPVNRNAVVVLNLALDPTPLDTLSVEQLKEKLYQPSSMLEENEQRLPIKLIHLNKCPVIAPAKTLSPENAARLGIDRERCLKHLEQIRAIPNLVNKLQELFESPSDQESQDPDYALYSGGFLSDADRARCEQIRQASPDQLSVLSWQFDDPRLKTLLFRFRARNYPATLNADELNKWQEHRRFRLLDSSSPASLHMEEYLREVERLGHVYQQDGNKLAILRALYQYAQSI
ncbi:exodeoxyribonuclease I [Bowmanella sp. Y26]|uniref:exodeoxyribonuclease I n=1 Tax=Bowmanella yangjiangensis TaxID=2811230 RepID=UPI001BDBDDD3|nr:exodeoxyribonuclease I [Bowmanella yangjiangensis]MBT1065167.1 exodeoxyribonuclease I [Bowmanella yangjiangensis]